ncbi:MAG: tetratricopeptide repeat protein [Rhodothermales bacterium]|nr:tetratricopeptide repeat protein [Rhodothermales bacterium]
MLACVPVVWSQSAELDQALLDLNEGRYEAVIAELGKEVNSPDTAGVAVTTYLSAFLHSGRYDEGLDEAERLARRFSEDPFVHFMRGRLLARVGSHDQALSEFREAGGLRRNFWFNAIEFAESLQRLGNTRDVDQIASTILSAYKQGYFSTAADLTVAARASAMVGDFHNANAAFRQAYNIDPRNVDNLFHWATVFRTKYNEADARRTFSEAIEINPNRSDLRTGLALAIPGFAAREKLADEAISINSNDAGALSIKASISLLDGNYSEASTQIDRALAIDGSDLSNLGRAAAIALVQDDTLRVQSLEEKALAINARPVHFYITAAQDLSLKFRYSESLDYGLAAMRANPSSSEALAEAGAGLLRIGRADEARRYLDRAFEMDRFNLYVGNMLTLIDEYDSFTTVESENFELVIHSSEAAILGPPILEVAEEAFEAMSAYYPYVPEALIRIEAYNDADDFAVRIAGIPHLGLLGVAFGDVVAINTPGALPGTPYNWARTLWHEIAHTMAIGTSGHRVPRWFTEGLSVYEERKARPEWGRELDLQLYTALDRDRLHHLAEMDRGFTRPEFPGQVLLSYYHASKIVEYLETTFGPEIIPQILVSLRNGDDIGTSLEAATGQSLQALDASLFAMLGDERDAFRRVINGLPDLLGDGGAPSLADPESGGNNRFLQELRTGYAQLELGNLDKAEQHFDEALVLFPNYVDRGNAYEGLASIFRSRNDTEGLTDILERFLAVSDYGVDAAIELTQLYLDKRDTLRAATTLRRTVDVDPYNVESRRLLGDLYLSVGMVDKATGERRAVVALGPIDLARAYYELADVLFLSGDFFAAKRAVLQSLEIAPGFRDAQRLLLMCVDGTE